MYVLSGQASNTAITTFDNLQVWVILAFDRTYPRNMIAKRLSYFSMYDLRNNGMDLDLSDSAWTILQRLNDASIIAFLVAGAFKKDNNKFSVLISYD